MSYFFVQGQTNTPRSYLRPEIVLCLSADILHIPFLKGANLTKFSSMLLKKALFIRKASSFQKSQSRKKDTLQTDS